MTGASAAGAQSSAAASRLAVVGAVITTIANFAIAWLVAREGAETAGLFFVSTAVITILGNSSCLGTMTGIVYFMPTALEGTPNPRGLSLLALRPVIILSSVAAGALALAAPTVADVISQDDADALATMLRVLAVAVIPWALTLSFTAITRALGSHTPTVATTQVLRPGLQIVALVGVFFASDAEPWMIALAWCGPVIIAAIAAGWWAHRLGGFEGTGSSAVTATAFWSYTRPRAVSTALQIALERIDVILVAAFVGQGPAGVYGALSRFVTAGNFVIYSVAQAVSPNLRRALSVPDWETARGLLHRATAWLVLLVWPYFLLLGLKPEPLAEILNPAFVSDASLLTVLAIGMMVSALAGPIELTLLMLGRSTLALVGVALAIVTDLVLIWLLAPHWGLRGAAIAWAASIVIQNLAATFFVGRLSGRAGDNTGAPLLGPSRRAAVAGAGAVVAVVPVALVTPNSLVGLLIAGFVAAPILAGWGWRFQHELGLDEVLPSRLSSR